MGNLAHSTADNEVLENSENKLLPGCRGVSKRSGTAGQEPPVRGGEQLVAVAVLEGDCFVKLVAHDKTLQLMRLNRSYVRRSGETVPPQTRLDIW